MKPKTKSILALTGTLVIGLVIGSLVTMQVVRQRIQDFKELRQPKNFKEHLMKAADPTDEQKAQIDPLLERFGLAMDTLHSEHKKTITGKLTQLNDSLSLYLDDRQMQRVTRKIKRMFGRMRKNPFSNAPPRPRKRRFKKKKPNGDGHH